MRKVLALSIAACLWSGPAAAGPLVGFLGMLNGGGWFAGAFGGSLGFWAGAATLAGRMVLVAGLQMASAGRRRQPAPAEIMVNRSQPLMPMERVYGRVRKGGPKIFTGFRFPYRWYAVAIAAHSTEGPVEHWLDDFAVEVSGAGAVTTAPVSGYGQIAVHLGAAGQTVDLGLDAAFAEINASFNFAGISYAVIRAMRASVETSMTVYPSNLEWSYAPVWDGDNRVYDPRDGQYKFTRNLALIVAKCLIHFRQPDLLYPVQTGVDAFGAPVYAMPAVDFADDVVCVDWDRVATEADICDQVVSNGEGGTQPLWTCDVVFDDVATWEDCRQVFALCGDVWFCETPGGAVDFWVGRYVAPDITLGDGDFLAVEFSDRAWGLDISGAYALRYIEPAMNYAEHVCGAIVLEDNGRRYEDECWAVSSHHQAARIASRLGRRERARYQISGTIKLIGYECIGKRFVRVNHQGIGFDQVIEVDALILNEDGITFSIQGRSVAATDWDFAASDEPARPERDQVASDGETPAPATLSGEVVTDTGGVALIRWSWPAQHTSLVQQLRTRRAGDADWQIITVAAGQASFVAGSLIDGATYEAQVRNRTAGGLVSDWSPSTPEQVDAVANTVPPADITGFAATVSGASAALTWVVPNDPIYDGTRIYRALASTSFGAASVVHTEFNSGVWSDVSPGAGVWSYWAVSINRSGVAGTLAGPETITII